MEEAASLFGPVDSASDPFGSIVGNGNDDLAESTAVPSSEPPLSETRAVNAGSGWFGGTSNHYQAEGSLHSSYDWQSSDDAGGHPNSQPRYGASTPSSSNYGHQMGPHESYNLQHTRSHKVGHVYQTQQHYEPIVEQASFERPSVLQTNDGLSDNPASSTLHAHAAHAQPAFDPYRPTTLQSSNGDSSHMYPKPSSASPPDRTTTYSAYQPVVNNSLSAPQSGYPSYSAPPRQLTPQVANIPLGTKDNPPDPSQATALYRPKTTNAYDPPIPPPKSSRHFIGPPGSSRVVSPTGVTQTYAAQEARHVPYQTNASSLPPGRYAPQAHAPAAPPTATHPPSIAQPASNVSPPRREPHSRIVPGRSIPAETPIGRSPYSAPLGPESPYYHTHTPSVPSMDAGAENILTDKLSYPVAVPRESELPSLNRADGHEFQPGQRVEFTAREQSSDSSLSKGQYDYPETGGGFAQHPITNSGYSPEVPRSLAAPMHTSSYEPLSYTPTHERIQSPSSSSVHSARSSRSRDLVSPPPSSIVPGTGSHAPVSAGPSTESGPGGSRVSSPASIRSWKSPHIPSSGPYAPARTVEPFTSTARDRSLSNSSLNSSHSSLASDRYAPSRRAQNPSEVSIPTSLHQTSRVLVHDADRSHGQTLILPPQTHAPYAPSPSLLGSNDPLGRTSGRAPVISFGFGGKLVLCFHGSNTLNTGFDVALSSRQTTGIQMRPLHAVIPESAIDHISASFPGPLFCDPGSPTGLVRTAVATQSKNNKAKVIEYLEGRAEEISRGLGYLSQGSPERRQAEGKHILVKLLRVLLEHDGHLSGSPQVEASVRAVLVPRLGDASGLEQSQTTSPKTALYGLDGAAVSSLALSAFDPHDRVLSVQTVRSSALDKIQDLLARGNRKAAYRYALDERLWAHAMIIASSIDKEAWKEVVNEFIRSELSSQVVADGTGPGHRDSSASGTGREPLKVAYSLYSGQGAASIQALVPPVSLIKPGEMLQAPALSPIGPISPNPSHGITAPISADVLKKWPDTAAMLIPGPSVSECSAALLALGDSLSANHWVEAAHACYLLAPQSTVPGTIGSPGRITLVGSHGPTATPNFHVNDDAIVLSEIVEFALSLAPLTKGQEPFSGLPHLQAYKLVRATNLAEMGHLLAASRYCEAITACLNRTHIMSHPELSQQLREFTDRLVGAPHFDKTGSWIRGKMTRPSLDTFGNWLGGRLTEFVAGGDDSPTYNGDMTPHENRTFAGPFSHYSTISSSTTSKAPSPQPTVVNNNAPMDAQSKVPRRTGSAQAVRLNSQVQIDRASSAMEYRPIYRNSSPGPRIVSANAATTQFPKARLNYPRANPTNDASQGVENETTDVGFRADAWWGSSSPEGSSTTTPTVSMFPSDSSSPPSGFVSLMDVPPTPAIPTSNAPTRSSTLATRDDDDDDDLGLGNSSRRRNASSNDSGSSDTTAVDPKAAQIDTRSRTEPKPNQQSSSWFSRWWSKEGSSGPIKATLGEESSFVYDKELKRWVNKKAGAEAAKPAAPPLPPSRAQTASPSHSAPRIPNGSFLAPPPARAASAIDLTSPPKRMSSRSRSNLVPTDGDGATKGVPPPSPRAVDSPPPDSSGSPTPPPSRPRSQAAKRNLRSRYVDVFQQPTGET